MKNDEFPDDFGEEIEAFDDKIAVAVRLLLQTRDFQAYLERLREVASPLIKTLFPVGDDERAMGAVIHALGREIWTHCPDPALDFRPRRLPKPQRNQPCPCGSGEKYKRCCANVPAELGPMPLLRHVMTHWPQNRFKEITFRHLDPEEVGAVALEWIEQGQERRAMQFLEALFASTDEWDGRMELAFDLLVDLYNDLGHPRKKERLVERGLESKNPAMRAVALQRLATIRMDQGDHEASWVAFQEAQRLDPDNPSLGVLEVTLLIGEGRFEEAKGRAAFWKARLERLGIDDLEDLIGFLARVTEQPLEAVEEAVSSEHPAGRLRSLLEATEGLPPGERLVWVDKNGAYLEPLEPLRQELNRWRQVFPEMADSEAIAESEEWLELLEEEPRLLTSFEVLDDLGLSLQDLVFYEEQFHDLHRRLAERAQALLETLIPRSGGEETRRLQWSWVENRAALRIIARHATLLADDQPEEAAELMAWLLELSPNDNLGMRIPLIHLYCGLGKVEEAQALAERHPDDFPSMQYGVILTHYLAGERGKALSKLSDLYREYPKILDTLVARNPREPAWSPYGATLGGEDEAWLYRQEFLSYWQDAGALDWVREIYPLLKKAKQTKKAKKKKRR